MRFAHPDTRQFVEIFLDALVSYHRLEFGSRLHLDQHTLPLVDLLLSLLQNVKATEADLHWIDCLFHDADLGGPGQPAVIDTTYVMGVCTEDWGWYKTVTMNLDRCAAAAPAVLAGEGLETAVRRIHRLRQLLEEAPKSLRWQVRARVGESRRWYEEPERVRRPSLGSWDRGCPQPRLDSLAGILPPDGWSDERPPGASVGSMRGCVVCDLRKAVRIAIL